MKSPRELHQENIERIDTIINKGNPYRDKLGQFTFGPEKIPTLSNKELQDKYSKTFKEASDLENKIFENPDYKKYIKENPKEYAKYLQKDKLRKQLKAEIDKRKNITIDKSIKIGNRTIDYKVYGDGRIEYKDKVLQKADLEYETAEMDWKQLPNTKNLEKFASFGRTKNGKIITQVRLETAKTDNKNFKNGIVTLYRGGIMRDGYNATSLSKKTAEGFGRYGYGNVPTIGLGIAKTSDKPMSSLYEIKVKQEDIQAFSFSESEAIINSNNIINQKEIRYSK